MEVRYTCNKFIIFDCFCSKFTIIILLLKLIKWLLWVQRELTSDTRVRCRCCITWGRRTRTIPRTSSTVRRSASTGSGTRGWSSACPPIPTTTSMYRCSLTRGWGPSGKRTWQKLWIQVLYGLRKARNIFTILSVSENPELFAAS